MSETKPPFGPLSARIEERILQPLRTSAFARRTWFSVTVASIVTVYAGLLGWMLWHDAGDPPRGAQMEETPVEVVAEVPKPPAPAPQPPSPKQEIEKPATSAPRAMNDVKEESERTDKDTHAPKKAAPPAEAEQKPTPDEAKEAAEAPAKEAPEKTEAAEAPKPPEPDKEAEALDRAPPEPPRKPAKLAQAKPAPPKPPHRPKSVAQQLAGASELPDYTFAKPMRKRAKVSGGSEDDRYLAVVYGLITQNRHAISVPYGQLVGLCVLRGRRRRQSRSVCRSASRAATPKSTTRRSRRWRPPRPTRRRPRAATPAWWHGCARSAPRQWLEIGSTVGGTGLRRLVLRDFRSYPVARPRRDGGHGGGDGRERQRQDQSRRGDLVVRAGARAAARRSRGLCPSWRRRRLRGVGGSWLSADASVQLGTGTGALPRNRARRRRGASAWSASRWPRPAPSPTTCASSGSPRQWTGCSPPRRGSDGASSTASCSPSTPSTARGSAAMERALAPAQQGAGERLARRPVLARRHRARGGLGSAWP